MTEENFYNKRDAVVKESWEEARLTAGELEYMQNQEDKLELPIIYEYAGGYSHIAYAVNLVIIMQILLLAICIPGIFTEEHSKKTDQLILSCELGKKKTYLAKAFT